MTSPIIWWNLAFIVIGLLTDMGSFDHNAGGIIGVVAHRSL